MEDFRRFLLKVLYPFLRWVGQIHMPWSRKQVIAYDLDEIKKRLLPGDILLSYTKGELTNFLIPSKGWKHVAIASYNLNYVIEANSKGVIQTDLRKFVLSKDRVALVRAKDVTPEEALLAAECATSHLGKPYDYGFNIPKDKKFLNDSFYCAELPYWCLKKVSLSFKFKLQKILGVETINPDDYYYAKAHFKILYDSEIR